MSNAIRNIRNAIIGKKNNSDKTYNIETLELNSKMINNKECSTQNCKLIYKN